MFKNTVEIIIKGLTQKGLLDTENNNIYRYALEALLLNASLLFTLLLISVSMGEGIHFICFLLFFIPLRILTGGYHANKSETCFVLSTAIYMITLIIVKMYPDLYQNKFMLVITAFFIIILLKFAPLVHKNHPLSEYQYIRNKKIVKVLLFMNILVFLYFLKYQIKIASNQILFLIMNGMILCAGYKKFEKGNG